MSLPVVLRPEATKDTAEAIGYFDALRPGFDPLPVFVPVLMRELGNSPRGVSEGGA